jgi:hypothetical protein
MSFLRLTGVSVDITVVNPKIDPTFAFMTVDHDGKIRMDCSSPFAMAGLVELKDRFDIAFGNDPDADRHGIVTPSARLLNPNHGSRHRNRTRRRTDHGEAYPCSRQRRPDRRIKGCLGQWLVRCPPIRDREYL